MSGQGPRGRSLEPHNDAEREGAQGRAGPVWMPGPGTSGRGPLRPQPGTPGHLAHWVLSVPSVGSCGCWALPAQGAALSWAGPSWEPMPALRLHGLFLPVPQ